VIKIEDMKSKTILYTMVAVCMGAFAFLHPNRLTAQSDTDAVALAAIVQDVQTQQTTLADNQKQIDSKLADIAESLRTARIYAGRGK